MTLCLLATAPALADDGSGSAEQETIRDIVEGQSEHDAILKRIEEERQRQLQRKKKLEELRRALENGSIQLDEAQKEAARLRKAATEQNALIAEQQQKMDRLVNQYDLYRRQNAAKWVVPIAVGLYAASRHVHDPSPDPAVWGFAGFGAMMAWEQTGYGPGRLIGSGIHYLYTKQWVW